MSKTKISADDLAVALDAVEAENASLRERLAEAERLLMYYIGDSHPLDCECKACEYLNGRGLRRMIGPDDSAEDDDACAHPSSIVYADGRLECEWCHEIHTQTVTESPK